jgi:hypothetical protein
VSAGQRHEAELLIPGNGFRIGIHDDTPAADLASDRDRSIDSVDQQQFADSAVLEAAVHR